MVTNANQFCHVAFLRFCAMTSCIRSHDMTRDLGDFIQPQGLSYSVKTVIVDASLDEAHDQVQITYLAFAVTLCNGTEPR